MKIIDNFLSKTYFKNISGQINNSKFEWNYMDCVTLSVSSTQFNEYGFSHNFLDTNGITGPWDPATREIRFSPFIEPLLFQILDVTDCDDILRARADMVTWSGKEDFIHPPHIDFHFPNTAAIFYVNESDGDTIFYNVKPEDVPNYKDLKEYDRVSPKANRLVIFEGDLLHTGCSPTKHKNRILINSNYAKKESKDEMKNTIIRELEKHG